MTYKLYYRKNNKIYFKPIQEKDLLTVKQKYDIYWLISEDNEVIVDGRKINERI